MFGKKVAREQKINLWWSGV